MNGATPEPTKQKRLTMSFLVSLMALCARHAKKIKLRTRKNLRRTHFEDLLKSPRFGISGEKHGGGISGERYDWCTPPRSPMRERSREIFTSLSNKAMTMVRRKKPSHGGDSAVERPFAAEETEEEYGVWQRAILMGDKCQPLDFSGVIYYDSNGRQLKELPPRSPRGSPLLNHHPSRSFVGSPLNPTTGHRSLKESV